MHQTRRSMAALLTVLWTIAFILSHSHSGESVPATLVLLHDAVNEGAVCLDGSPPGYLFRPGIGSGENSWIIHLEGGGWCSTLESCASRSKTRLGSSNFWPKSYEFNGFLSSNRTENEEFYNWNMAFLAYCDGMSFAGNVDESFSWQGTKFYIRGFPVLEANIKSLLDKGMDKAEQVILTGCSAGGIGTYIHADYVKTMLSPSTTYHAMADAGYFIDAANKQGQYIFQEEVKLTVELHKPGLNQQCVAAHPNDSWKCFIAQYMFKYIKTPLFMLNSAWDTWQLENILNCTTAQGCPRYNKYGQEFVTAAEPVIQSQSSGVFIDSCLYHCQSLSTYSWTQIKVGGKTAYEAFVDWYFKDLKTKLVDCSSFPCNPTCKPAL